MYKLPFPLCLFFTCILLISSRLAQVQAAPPPLHAEAAILLDAKTGQVLYEKNSRSQKAPASTTKIMTAILAIESGKLDEETVISRRAAATPGSSMHLYAGQKISLRELLTGLLLRSGNDAAVAIAEHLSGSVPEFSRRMNEKAAAIGAVNSHFVNPHGLTHPDHYVTAYDLAIITRYALTNPIFAELVRTKETQIDWIDQRGRESDQLLHNTNRLLWMLAEADGVKTGTTGAAGPCLVASATRGNQKLIAVILHDHSRWQDAASLLRYGLHEFALFDYAASGETVASIAVENGPVQDVNGRVNDNAGLSLLRTDLPLASVECQIPDKIKAPVYRGQKIGEIVFFIAEKPVKRVDIVAETDIPAQTAEQKILFQLLSVYRHLSRWGAL